MIVSKIINYPPLLVYGVGLVPLPRAWSLLVHRQWRFIYTCLLSTRTFWYLLIFVPIFHIQQWFVCVIGCSSRGRHYCVIGKFLQWHTQATSRSLRTMKSKPGCINTSTNLAGKSNSGSNFHNTWHKRKVVGVGHLLPALIFNKIKHNNV